ncbi:MAG: hypothetical protein IJI19_03100, partial [Ruminococcus sp.]|nr:hypothetical protein [Ruminococcus sp.]
WFPDGLGNNYGENGEITADGDYDVYFRPDGNGNVDNGWHYGFIKAITAGTELPTEPEVTEPVYTPGYYIIGNFNNYEIDEAYMMSLNENQTEYDEFVFDDLALTTGSRFKVAYVDANGYQTTYPGSILADYGAWGQIKSNDTYTVYFRPDGNGDGAWYYGYIKVPGNFVPVEEGYYVIGDFTDWQLDAAYQMTVNPDADTTEYVFRNLNLTTDNQFKVVHTENGYETNTWYPDGIGNNYGENGEIPVNAAYDIYFRPNGDGEGWFYNYIFAQDLTPYTVTWYAEDGETVLETDENVLRGTAVSFDGEEPTKEGNAQYSYTFDGWDPAADTVTGNMSFIAKFKQITNKYTIKFVDEDGTELQSSEVEYGTTPVYNGEIPTKAGDDQYTYIFNGWDSELAAVTGDKTYTATYRTTTNEYTIKFVNFDGAELQSSQVSYGEIPVYTGETPTKAGNAQYTYTFKDWDTAIEPVTGEKTYTATYDETVNKYTVTFVNYDDSVLQSSEFEYGTAPSYEGDTPIKP